MDGMFKEFKMAGADDFSYANLANLGAIDALYKNYLQNPESVDLSWRHFFDGMQFAENLLPTFPLSRERRESRSQGASFGRGLPKVRASLCAVQSDPHPGATRA